MIVTLVHAIMMTRLIMGADCAPGGGIERRSVLPGFAQRGGPVRNSAPGSPCVADVHEKRPVIRCAPRPEPDAKNAWRPRPRAPPQPPPTTPAYGYGGYYDNAPEPEPEPEPMEDDLPDSGQQWCPNDDGGDEPEHEEEAEDPPPCPMGGWRGGNANNNWGGGRRPGIGGGGGGVARSGNPGDIGQVLNRPQKKEVCQGTQGLTVVRLLTRPSEVDLVCLSISATPAGVNPRNEAAIAAIIRKCAHDTEQVLVGSWYGDDSWPSLVFSPKRGQVQKRKNLAQAAVLCQSG